MNSKESSSNEAPVIKPILHQILVALGSLRITVFLLIVALVLVLIATLQQTRKDIYKVKQQHFSTPVVFIEFQELLTPAWFPETQDVGGGFLMPSGATIMIAMLLNLLCAHATRFRIQAKGKRLLIGSVFLLFGIITTLLIINNGNARGEFQEEPIISWQTQWQLLQGLLGAAALAGLAGSALLESRIRRTFSFVTGLILAGLLAFLLYKGQSSFIGNDAMRVVWRLVQGSVAAIVCYIGALMVFRRKAGIVIIHAGLLLLMVGELYTTYSASEQRLFFYEGDTTRHTIDVNQVEMAVIASASPEGERENVVAIPARHLANDGALVNDLVPFNISTIAYYPNSRLFNVRPGDDTVPNAKGLARFVYAEQVAEVTGTDADEVNSASAYVQLTDRETGNDLGTYLISQQLYQNDSFDLDTIRLGGQDYQIGLRFKHHYKPYSVYLEKTTRENYTGTDTPKTYSSTFRIMDPDNNVDEEKYVSMNNPLRYNNETFYQSGHDTDKDGRRYSVLQVVRNTGWMIPYVSCAMVGIGLLLHFLGTFLRFVERLSANRQPSAAWDRTSLAFVVGFVLLFAMFAWRKVPKPVVYEEMNLEQYGQIPVAFGGRVQPLDSLARSTLRRLRKYEIPVKWDSVEGEDVPYAPIRWLADWVFGAEGSDEYRIFKIEDPNVINSLSLIRRKSHLYSMKELNAVREKLNNYLRAAALVRDEDKSRLTAFQKKIIKLGGNVQRVESLRFALGSPEVFQEEDPIKSLEILIQAQQGATNVPMAIPGESENDWSVLSPVLAPEWIKTLCEEYETTSAREVARRLVEVKSREKFQEIILEQEMRRSLVRILGLDPANVNQERLDEVITAMMSATDPVEQAQTKKLIEAIQPRVNAQVDMQVESMTIQVADELAKFAHVTDGHFDFDRMATRPPISRLAQAYRDKDAVSFNESLELHLEQIGKAHDVAANQGKVTWEHRLNRLSPFYLATAIYIGAFILSLMSWLFLTGSQASPGLASYSTGAQRAAYCLVITAFLLHTIGLLMRIYVSGRPPVTNLYGSAVFVGWVGVLFGLFTERMLGYCFGCVKSSFAGVTTLLTAFALGAEGDTFSVLQAVLDTQFWLSTHVVTISIGYAGTLAAGVLAILYLLTSMLVPKDLTESRKTLARMVYGVTCMSLIFSFVGTVLGGLWADDSWGRFWGWDPKENGALMIVLVNAILLHARWAGLVKDRGMAIIAVVGNIVTLWSWFAVNELGIGLHSYGLTEGRMKTVGFAWLGHLILALAAWGIPMKYWLGNRAAAGNRTTS